MIEIIYFLILILSIFLLNKFFINKKLLLSQSGEKHQRFVDKDNLIFKNLEVWFNRKMTFICVL